MVLPNSIRRGRSLFFFSIPTPSSFPRHHPEKKEGGTKKQKKNIDPFSDPDHVFFPRSQNRERNPSTFSTIVGVTFPSRWMRLAKRRSFLSEVTKRTFAGIDASVARTKPLGLWFVVSNGWDFESMVQEGVSDEQERRTISMRLRDERNPNSS